MYETFKKMQVSILLFFESLNYILCFQQSNGMVINNFGATFQQLVNLLRTHTSPPLVRILKKFRNSLTPDEKLKYFGPEERVLVIKKEETDIVDLTLDEDSVDIK